MGVSKNMWFSPQIMHFNRVSHYKPSILGYPYFWKHPYRKTWKTNNHDILGTSWPRIWIAMNKSRWEFQKAKNKKMPSCNDFKWSKVVKFLNHQGVRENGCKWFVLKLWITSKPSMEQRSTLLSLAVLKHGHSQHEHLHFLWFGIKRIVFNIQKTR